MRDGAMDAFFFVGGFPAGAIAELASQEDIVLVPIGGKQATAIRGEYTFFAENVVPAGTYEGVETDVPTLAVGAQWVTNDNQPEELIYEITKRCGTRAPEPCSMPDTRRAVKSCLGPRSTASASRSTLGRSGSTASRASSPSDL
jgi:hypothetical protein